VKAPNFGVLLAKFVPAAPDTRRKGALQALAVLYFDRLADAELALRGLTAGHAEIVLDPELLEDWAETTHLDLVAQIGETGDYRTLASVTRSGERPSWEVPN
jgi:hypothetical protein